MANTTGTTASAAKAQAALAKELRQRNNENTAKFFVAGMASMILLFMIFHWTRFVYKKYESKNGTVTALTVPIAITRYLPLFYSAENLTHAQ
jgi:putative effector of murein hydrolase